VWSISFFLSRPCGSLFHMHVFYWTTCHSGSYAVAVVTLTLCNMWQDLSNNKDFLFQPWNITTTSRGAARGAHVSQRQYTTTPERQFSEDKAPQHHRDSLAKTRHHYTRETV
jgi:hypothetical protein